MTLPADTRTEADAARGLPLFDLLQKRGSGSGQKVMTGASKRRTGQEQEGA